jgi:predicted ATPase
VGRESALARLRVALDRARSGRTGLALVSGEAGVGKTALLTCFVDEATVRGEITAWGTSWHSTQAPAFWPWIEVIRSVADADPQGVVAGLRAGERAQLARLVPEFDENGTPCITTGVEQARFELLTAVATFLERAARASPLVVVLDDLHWADPSSLELLEFVARRAQRVPLLLVGAYRHDEIEPGTARVLGGLAGSAESVHLSGLNAAEVTELMQLLVGDATAARWADEVLRRSGGHPFFVRELAYLLAAGGSDTVPHAVREVIERRLGRLGAGCVTILEAAAVGGNQVLADVLAEVCALDPAAVAEHVTDVVRAGVLVADGQGIRFAHDLFRETVYAALGVRRRLALHAQTGAALERRRARGGTVFAGDVARHYAAAITPEGLDRALWWARAAAADDERCLAFGEAADHLARVRAAAEDAGVALPRDTLVDLLVAEADRRGRGDDPALGASLLGRARDVARTLDDPVRLADVALGVQRLGARFGMPRTKVTDLLEESRAALAGSGPRWRLVSPRAWRGS